MPTLSNPELAEALEGANSLILRWGHNQMRQLKAEEVERIVAALKASASSETGPSAESLKLAQSVLRNVDEITNQTAAQSAECLAREVVRLGERPRGD